MTTFAVLALSLSLREARGADGVFVRFRMDEPAGSMYHVRLGGYIHQAPWYLPKAVVPTGAAVGDARDVPAGQYTPWFDLQRHAGKLLHGRLQRSGGVAEFPNVTADFVCDPPADRRAVTIELATAPKKQSVVKRFEEIYRGSMTSFLVSPALARDAQHLETASQMARRRLGWAQRATGGQRHSPERLIVQTSFWAPQRPELNLTEAETLHLLGFNVVGNQMDEVVDAFDLSVPGHTHDIDIGPAATREKIDARMKRHAERDQREYPAGVPYGFSDEVCARPPIGDDTAALQHFHSWLEARGTNPGELGVERLDEVEPIETPAELREREPEDPAAARRVFYYTSRFRQQAAARRLRWHTEAFHRYFGEGPRTSTLVADHPYFSGTGLGMGMEPNWTWGGHPLALDWFAVGRDRCVDLIGIEDWMGLQYMYGPDSTWEGFQLMGFQAAIFRSASRGKLPIIAWITPSDQTNLRLKTASALCQGAKHFFYWTYGPTATSTENYWSDLESAYDGIATMTRHLAAAEPILALGSQRQTRLALLYSVSSDLWQPFGYVHMLERRGLYLSLVHDQYLVDMISEDDVIEGRLDDYDALYTADPCIARRAAERIGRWVADGGHLFASCAAGSLDEFGEPSAALASVFGIDEALASEAQPGRYSVRAGVNQIPYLDRIELSDPIASPPTGELGVIGARVRFDPAGAKPAGHFSDGRAAIALHRHGAGQAMYFGACPGIAYIKEARFVRDRLAEKWPAGLRRIINRVARGRGVERLAELSSPVVEAGVYDGERGTALVLANFTYQRIPRLDVVLRVARKPRSVRSLERGRLDFSVATEDESAVRACQVRFRLDLDLTDIVLLEW